MAEYRDLTRGQVLPASFLAALQEYIGTGAGTFHLSVLNPTTIQIVAGSNSAQAALGIDGLWRYISATVSTAVTGAAGTYDIFATTGPNSFSDTPNPDTDNTDYAFALSALPHGTTPTLTGSLTNFRKIGELDWSGSQITAVRQLEGNFSAVQPLTPTAPTPQITPLRAVGASGQSAPLATFEEPAGTIIAQILAGALNANDDSDAIPTTAWVQALVSALTDARYKPGDLIFTAATTRSGALFCDGSVYNQSQEPALYAAIGQKYGIGDGSTGSFNVPDYTGMTLLGAGTSNTNSPWKSSRSTFNLADHGGNNNMTLGVGNLPPHQHDYSGSGSVNTGGESGHQHAAAWGDYMMYSGSFSTQWTVSSPTYNSPANYTSSGVYASSVNGEAQTGGSTGHYHGVNYSWSGTTTDVPSNHGLSGTAFSLMQPYAAVNIFIKT